MTALAALLAAGVLAAILIANGIPEVEAQAGKSTRMLHRERRFRLPPWMFTTARPTIRPELACHFPCTCKRLSRWTLRMRANCRVFWHDHGGTRRVPHIETSVDEVDFEGSVIYVLNARILEGLVHIKVIRMEEVFLQTVDKEAFTNLKDLWSLSLARNHLSHLDRTTFTNNERLHHLSLRGNQLLEMPVLESSSLQVLDMADCGVTHLAQEHFAGLPALSQLHLEGNILRSLDPTAMSPLSKLSRLFLQHNRLVFFPNSAIKELPSLLELRLDNNMVMEGPVGPLEAPLLQRLSASNCSLESLQPNLLTGAPELRYLDVSNNRLHTLWLAGEPTDAHLVLLDASNNPLACDCALRDSWVWARDHVTEARVFCGDPPHHWDNASLEQLSCKEVQTPEGSRTGGVEAGALALWVSLSLLAVLAALGAGLVFVYRRELLARYFSPEGRAAAASRGIDIMPLEENRGDEDGSIGASPNGRSQEGGVAPWLEQ